MYVRSHVLLCTKLLNRFGLPNFVVQFLASLFRSCGVAGLRLCPEDG
jgi:hypothetical protein